MNTIEDAIHESFQRDMPALLKDKLTADSIGF
jgi:hypothetical protein